MLPGAVVLLIAVALIGVGWRRGLITGAPRTLLLAGTPATLLTIAALAQSRAGLVGANLYDSNRYLAGVAIPLVIALVPACAASVRGFARPLLAPIAPVLIALAFVGGLAPLRHYRASFVGANVAVRTAAASAAIVVRDGCPSGAAPDPASTPAGALSPQMNTALITELMRRGALHAPTEGDADPAVVARLCPP